MRTTALLLAAIMWCACNKTPGAEERGGEHAGDATSSSVAVAGNSAVPAPSAAPSGARASAASSWSGSYKSGPAALTVPPGWKGTTVKSEGTAGIGEGKIELAVDSSGRAQGSLEGALGPATLDGALADGRLTATIRRKDPSDHGFTGTLEGTLSSGRIEGTMQVSLAQATMLRAATFTLSPAAGGAR